jgi:hypothetical protein
MGDVHEQELGSASISLAVGWVNVGVEKRPKPHPILTPRSLCSAVRRLPAFRGLAYAALALVAVSLLVPLAAAQTTPQIVQVVVTGAPDEFTIRKSHGSAAFRFNISFMCQSGGSFGPCTGQPGETDVQVSALETKTPYPDGWEVKVDLSQVKKVKARQSIAVPVTVRLLDDEPREDRFSIGLSVTAQPVTNTNIDPLLGSQLGQSSTASDSVGVDKILNFGEQLTSWARAYMWPLLGAAVILLVAGVVLVERKRGSLDLASDAPSQSIAAGRGTSFPIRLANEAKNDDRVNLGVVNLPPDWTAIVPLSELELRGGERTQMWITLRAPPEAVPGQSLTFGLRARSTRSSRSADLPLHVTVVAGGSTAPPAEIVAPPPPPPIEFEEETVEAQPRARRRR